jgi:hypothetical protein
VPTWKVSWVEEEESVVSMAVAAILIGERVGRRSCGIEVDMLEYVVVCFGAWRDQSCPANFVEDQGGVAVTKPWGPLEDLRYWRYLIALPPYNVLIARTQWT